MTIFALLGKPFRRHRCRRLIPDTFDSFKQRLLHNIPHLPKSCQVIPPGNCHRLAATLLLARRISRFANQA